MPTSIVLVVLSLVLAAPAAATDYWVKNGGNDGATGLSPAAAWATLNHAADVVDPGDTVHVLDGDYQGFDLRRSGTPGNPITFKAEGSAVRITADNGTTPDGINVENAAHVVIDGFVVDDRTRAGIRVAVSQFVTVRNCHAGGNGKWGIFSGFADDLTIENNETHHSQDEHGIYVSNSGDRPIIRGNHVHDNHGNGIHMNGDESQGGDGSISDALVERNRVHGNGAGGGSGINMDGVTDSVVRNNLLWDNHASGISLYRIDGATGSTGNLVINNTVVNAADGRWCVNINNGSSGNTIVNNILYNLHSFRGVITVDPSSETGLVSDYNSVMSRFSIDDGDTVVSLAAWQGRGHDLHSFIATPGDLFVSPGIDFHLLPGGPAVDEGTSTGAPSDDLDGDPRPVGGGVDVGAYELQLLECGDGGIDPGEQCGEPGLSCADPCTHCAGCVCAANAPVCGDGDVCGSEACEIDADCGGGLVCTGCQCVNPPACTSGILLEKPKQKLRASPFNMSLKGEAVIPKPWVGVDPPANGVRVVIDAVDGAGGLDVTLPGGAAWSVNNAGNQWTYSDAAGAIGGITKVTIKDRSTQDDGRLRIAVRGRGGSLVLPPAASVRTAVVLGTTAECAGLVWNGPGEPKPRCDGDASRLRCR